jgi:hypothetical protein
MYDWLKNRVEEVYLIKGTRRLLETLLYTFYGKRYSIDCSRKVSKKYRRIIKEKNRHIQRLIEIHNDLSIKTDGEVSIIFPTMED